MDSILTRDGAIAECMRWLEERERITPSAIVEIPVSVTGHDLSRVPAVIASQRLAALTSKERVRRRDAYIGAVRKRLGQATERWEWLAHLLAARSADFLLTSAILPFFLESAGNLAAKSNSVPELLEHGDLREKHDEVTRALEGLSARHVLDALLETIVSLPPEARETATSAAWSLLYDYKAVADPPVLRGAFGDLEQSSAGG